MANISISDFFQASDHQLVIRDIFAMYHHEWDMIGESVQNAVDSVLRKNVSEGDATYIPTIRITYDLSTRKLVVEDNGEGIPAEQVKKVAAPHFSKKDPRESNRGEFGVGLSFVAFSSDSFDLVSSRDGATASIHVGNGYRWANDRGDDPAHREALEITDDSQYQLRDDFVTMVTAKPTRFPVYTFQELIYILRRHTAIGDFWSYYNDTKGVIKVTLRYIDAAGKSANHEVENRMWHPADQFSKLDLATVDVLTVKEEVEKGADKALPNWIGMGLTAKGKKTIGEKDYTYSALFCRASYYSEIADVEKLFLPVGEKDEEPSEEHVNTNPNRPRAGIYVSKKGMPLGVVVDPPRTSDAGYWRNTYFVINCDAVSTEPGRKKLHVDDEPAIRSLAKEVFTTLTGYSHYFIPKDPDAEHESLIRNLDKVLKKVEEQRTANPLVNPRNQIAIQTEPANEQTTIALFHELIGAKILKGYRLERLSASDTYDGVYSFRCPKIEVGRDYWPEWIRLFEARERKEIEKKGEFFLDDFVIEFKLHLEAIIKDFLTRTKYHPQIKLLVAWDADSDLIRNKGWLLEDLPKTKRRFPDARWRLRPNSEGQSKGIVATDVLLLKPFLETTQA